MKIKVNIQSYSDIITNSSSELFCSIYSDDLNNINRIENLLASIFQDDCGDTYVNISTSRYDNDDNEIETNPYVELHLGYHVGISDEYIRATLIPYLDNKIGSGNYKIEFN